MYERVPSTSKEQQVCSHLEINLLDLNSFSGVDGSLSINLHTLGTPAFQFCWIPNYLQQPNKAKQSRREYWQSERQKTQRKHNQLCQYRKKDLIPWEVLPNVPTCFALRRTEDQLHSPEPQQYAWKRSWQRQAAGLAVCAAVSNLGFQQPSTSNPGGFWSALVVTSWHRLWRTWWGDTLCWISHLQMRKNWFGI